MKAIIWFIYISSIVILCVQADVQDNDHPEICSKCADASLPRCESTDEERLDKKVDCQLEGCVVRLDTETNYICLIELQSSESSKLESKGDVTEVTVQPVPIALQMVPTTESSKDVSKEISQPIEFVEENDKAVEQLESNTENTDHNAALEADVEEADKTAEKVEEPQTEESEHMEEQSATVSEDEAASEQENPVDPPEKNEATVAEIPLTAGGEATNTANSQDYPADAPANEESESQLPDEPPENAAAVEDNNEKQNEQENMSDTHEEAAAGNKEPDSNGEQTAVTDNNDNETNIGTQIQINNAEGDDVTSEGGDTMTEQPSTATGTDNSLPVNADQSLSCFSCTSSEDAKCAQGPGRAINCPGKENKQNGCYTLYKVDTNITTRGCISELTSEGFKYCKSNAKKCFLCYEKGCNNLLAPSAASRNFEVLSFWLAIVSLMFIKIMIN